jgi:hypothetical protein
MQMSVKWPPLVVRSWHGVLYERDRQYFFDWNHDPVQEATISRRMHELRGLVVGQVAEIESALLGIASEIRDRHPGPLPNRQKRKGAGGALNDVRKLLPTLSVGDELAQQLALIDQVIRRRNKLMHARIYVGFDRLGPHSGLEPVIYLLQENDAAEADVSKGADADTNGNSFVPDAQEEACEGEEVDLPEDEMEYGEIGEFGLERYLEEAYVALEAAVDIWQKVDRVLPEKKYS